MDRVSWTSLLGVSLVVAALALAAFAASAASLGTITLNQIFAQTAPASAPVPTVIGGDDFPSCTGALHGETDSQGNTWTDHWGRWRCLGGDLVRATRRLPLAHATVDVGQSDRLIISTDLERISNQANRSGPGISLFTTGFFHMYVIYERDQGRVTIGKWTPWASVPLASVPISDRSTATLTVVVDQPSLTVLVNGSQVMTYDLNNLTPPEQALLLTNTRFGLEADRDTWSRFDSFRVEAMP